MNETTRRFARLVDLSAVQATSTEADVRACAELAARYNIISVHVLPCWTRFLSTLLPQQGTGEVMIGGPVGFPGGGHTTDTKVQEVRQLIADGAREVDMVVNIGKVLSGDYDYVREDLRRVVEAAAPVPYGGRPPATVYARCFTAILKRQRKLRLLVLADRCMAPSFWTTVASWWRIGRCCGMISAASRKLTPLTRAKVGKSGWRI